MVTWTFPDVSNNNGVLSLTGAPAAIAKATEGTGFVDQFYAGHLAQAVSMGIPFAGYHYLHHGDIAAQAQLAFSVVGPGTPLMLDVETVTIGGVPQPDPTLVDVLAFSGFYRSMGGKLTLCYLPRWFWQGHWGSPDLTALRGMALVASSYNGGYDPSEPGWLPYGGLTPAILQYTDAAPFNGENVDYNAFPGDLQQLRDLFNGGPAGAPVQPSEDDMRFIRDASTGAIYAITGAAQNRLVLEHLAYWDGVYDVWGLTYVNVPNLNPATYVLADTLAPIAGTATLSAGSKFTVTVD